MRLSISILTGLFAGLVLGACQVSTQPRPFLATVDPGSYLSYAAGRGPIPVEIISYPLEAGPPASAALRETVRAALFGRNNGPVIELDVQARGPGFELPEGAWFLVSFDPAPTPDAYGRCSGKGTARKEKPTTQLAVSLDFCQGDTLLSSVSGETPRPGDLSDPGLKNLLGLLMQKVIPIAPDDRSGCTGLACT